MKAPFSIVLLMLIASGAYNQKPSPPQSTQFADQVPEFPGGQAALESFIAKNLKYPLTAQDKTGQVIIQFTIEVDGSEQEIHVVKGLGSDFDAEALRVVKLLPKFTPGIFHGKPVKGFYNVAADFDAENHIVGATEIYPFVEQNPQFPGGDEALIKFLKDNVVYPSTELKNGIDGKVLVKFVVDTDGSVKDPVVSKSVSPGIDSEALRVVNMLPRFRPGAQQGIPIKVYYNVPVKFTITDKDLILLLDVFDKYYKSYWAVEGAGQYRAGNYEASIPPFIKLADETKDGMVYAMVAECYKNLSDKINFCAALGKAIELNYKPAEVTLQKECK